MSELLEAVYQGDKARTDELLAADPDLDVFEAAAVGRTDRLRGGEQRDDAAVGVGDEVVAGPEDLQELLCLGLEIGARQRRAGWIPAAVDDDEREAVGEGFLFDPRDGAAR